MNTKNNKNRKKIKREDRLVILAFLVGLAFMFVFCQHVDSRVFAKIEVQKNKPLSQKNLFIIAPKKELMSSDALRSESDALIIKNRIVGKYSIDQFIIKKNIEKLVGNRPMRSMVEEIANRNMQTAAYLVAIAKHESNLGKFSPKNENGKDCYNYWGFRGTYNKTKSGYSCFDSPQQAIRVVGNRIQGLNELEGIDTPEEMLIWKCGGSCAGHDPADVVRWKDDVDFYFRKVNQVSFTKGSVI